MEKIKDHISVVFKIASFAKPHFLNKKQDEIERFAFCGIEKVHKISSTFLRLYSEMIDDNFLEFSLGILSRSVLMDMILVNGLKSVCYEYNGNDKNELKDKVKSYCYKVICDGTAQLIEEVFNSDELSHEQKIVQSQTFASVFFKAFDTSTAKPKLKKHFRFRLREIYEGQDSRIVTGKTVYNLYSYYSKYDHLSHLTSLSSHIPFDSRKGKLDLSIILMVMHLRDLLTISYDFCDNHESLLPYMEELQDHLKQSYDEEINNADLETRY
jgi:hypothetical protein